ncbi:hypothetical protein ACHHYP_03644 [Achlya hypogyna]|uniref:PB1 domain-containing protein n=1 Tax=Achlya hypogyna TaxID=1202772 RepID=A0A1V9Z3C4_ACHHY|nr:hypothetical protein ACHHYP_03644 [Achlya hypogyna]
MAQAEPEHCAVTFRVNTTGFCHVMNLAPSSTLADVHLLVAHAFGLPAAASPKDASWELTYVDDEGDVLHVINDSELTEALTQPDLVVDVRVKRNISTVLEQEVLPAVQATFASVTDWFAQLQANDEVDEVPAPLQRRDRAESDTESESDDDN